MRKINSRIGTCVMRNKLLDLEWGENRSEGGNRVSESEDNNSGGDNDSGGERVSENENNSSGGDNDNGMDRVSEIDSGYSRVHKQKI